MSEIKEGFLQIILTVALSASTIIILYFTYGTVVEGQLVVSQVSSIVDTYTSYYSLVAGTQPAAACSAIVAPDQSATDAILAESNKKLLDVAAIALTIGCATVITVFFGTYYTGRRPNIPVKTMVARSLINVAAVAAVEIAFLKLIIANYINVDANTTTLFALEALQKNA